jgi:hypothetical protein
MIAATPLLLFAIMQAMDTRPHQNGDGDIDISNISNQAIQQAVSIIICSDLANYGFHVCPIQSN